MMTKSLLWALGFPALFTLIAAQRLTLPFNASVGQYNAPCLTSSQCDQQKGLYCVPATSIAPGNQPRCRCPTNGTLYDEVRNRCVGRIQENCVYYGNSSLCPMNAHCSHQDPRNPSLYFYESKCFCDPNFIPNERGTCTPAARFGEFCNHSDKRCDIASGLLCDPESKTCVCEFDTSQYYDKDQEKCLSFINQKCTTYFGCVENARCDGLAPARSRTFVSATNSRKPANSDTPTISVQQEPKPRKVSQDGRLIGTCKCEYGFSPANNGRCMAGYRYTCSAESPCNPFDSLDCYDGICNCLHPLHQFYDFNRKKCITNSGGKCSGKPAQECVDNADCINGLCTCKKGFRQTPHRKCLLDYLEKCDNNCNIYAGLVCKAGQCVCMDDSLVYNTKLSKCVSKVGQPCGKIGQAGEYGKEPYYVGCETPAVCKQEVVGDLSTSFCRV
ncbi:hypothetical protein Ocin01_06819 [Orchesella cincta]|uniref:Tenascin-X n=1 Tax=Orchesella cincta TaxID=48709 RepID=A0A1D2N3N0_ORCCI|nr:hypothetical protein Ocin01_06819 [Orchesella cincta]